MTAKDRRPDLQADLTADLLSDLTPPPLEAPTVPDLEPADLPQDLHDVTPAVSFLWTPLRWSRPKVVRAEVGPGKALKLGPLKVELSVKK